MICVVLMFSGERKSIMAERGTLNAGEAHPSAHSALAYVGSLGLPKLFELQGTFSSCAIEGNRLSEICSETLRRCLADESVSDRYILGLAWAIKEIEEKQNGRQSMEEA